MISLLGRSQNNRKITSQRIIVHQSCYSSQNYSVSQTSYLFERRTKHKTSSGSRESMMSVIIEYQVDKRIEIKIPENLLSQLTSEWLLKEAMKRMQAKGESTCNTFQEDGSLIALKTKSKSFAVDYLLSDPKSSLQFLKNGTVLEPYYCVDTRQLDEFRFKVELEDFEIETILGQGAFSAVYLARRKATGKLYALKQVQKGSLSRRKRKVLERERNSLIEMSSPFIVPLHWIFQTANFCYFVLEFVPCGDLRHLISIKKRLNESEAKFFIAETILGLSTIHANNFLHRDLKPENLLFGLDGHIKIADFGLAKRVNCLEDPNYSRCGTEGIMAPEITHYEGYNCFVDYYNIGTLTFELVTGKIPQVKNENGIFNKDILDNFNLSPQLQDFICRLLDNNPSARLGAKKGFTEICSHPWLQELNMIDISKKKMRPPLKVDPNSIKYKIKNVNYDIDEIKDDLNEYEISNNFVSSQGPQRTLLDFSFYGFGDEVSNLITCYRNPPSFTKIPTLNNIATAISPYATSTLRKALTATYISDAQIKTSGMSKFKSYKTIPLIINQATDEIMDENDIVESKLKKYTQGEFEDYGATKNILQWSANSKDRFSLKSAIRSLRVSPQ